MFSADQIKSLNELEREVCRYVITNEHEVAHMSIRELAHATHVSTTTVLHFCKKMDCEGFSEFKIMLRNQLDKEETPRTGDDRQEIARFVEQLGSRSYQPRLVHASEMLASADVVIFYGIGNSRAVADYAARYLSSLGAFALSIDDPFYPVSVHEGQKVAAVLLSVSGETPQVLETIRYYREHRYGIVAITNRDDSSLSQLADITLSYYITRYDNHGLDLTTQVPAVLLVETLARWTVARRKERRA